METGNPNFGDSMKLRALILALACTSAQAEFKDGNSLLSLLKDPAYFNQGYAMGYVVGVADMGLGVVHCAPPNTTAGQLNDMVKNYLENTPAERHLTGDIVVNRVLKAVWPCPKKGTAL
jgi:hypothetical protein